MNRNRWLSLLSPILLLALWELAVQLGWLNRIFFPPPSEVSVTLGELVASGRLFSDVGVSLWRIGAGFLLGGLPAIVVGLLMGISPLVRAIAQPLAAAIYPIPKIALLPLVIVLLGIGEASKVATIAVSVFFLVVLNVAASVLQVDARYFEVARSFGARRSQLFWSVALPGSLPGIMTSIKLGMGFALTLIVGVEFVGANDGIGYLIWQSYEIYAIDRMIAGLVAVALLGWLITVLLDEVEHFVVPWQATATRETALERGMRQFVHTWWGAIRPWSYTAAIIPVVLGTVVAAYDGYFNLVNFALALIGSIAIQAGTNLMNDYYDYTRGTDTPQVLGTGGALLRGDLKPRQIFAGGVFSFALGSAIGLYLVSVTGPFIFWLGVFSVLAGYFYTAGPFAFAYNGLGEIAVFIFMGPVMVIGAYYVQAQSVPLHVIYASLPVGFLVAAILHANNLRDLDSDRQKGKRTLATILGRAGANMEYYLLVGGTYVSLLVLVLLGIAPWPALVAALTLPTALKLMNIVANNSEPAALQPVLRQTARLHGQFGILMVVGWTLAIFIGMGA